MPNQDGLLQQLESNLNSQLELYAQLLIHLGLEKQVLIEALPEKIDAANKEKELLLLKIKGFEQLRIKWVEQLGYELKIEKIDAQPPRLLELAKQVSSEWSKKLTRLHSEFDSLLTQIQIKNRDNSAYIDTALETLNGAINQIKGRLGKPRIYQKQGIIQTSDRAGGLVSKEV